MRIVITGASGNVGTALLRLLTGDSTHHIVGVTRRKPPAVAPYSGVTWIACDIGGRDAAVHLTDVFLGADVVVHLAWQIQPSHDREQLRRTNQDGTQAVLEAVRRAAVPHLVHMSSIGAYTAAHGQAVDESWPTQGIQTSSYSVDKAACERMLDEYEDGRTITRVRPSVILQEDAASEISRYFMGRLVPIHLMQPALVRLVPFPRDLSAQFVHAQDVAGALARIIAGQAGGAFNLAAEPPIDRERWRQVFGGVGPPAPIRLLRAGAAATWRLRLQPTGPGWLDMAVAAPRLRTDRARQELGWVPRHRADETLSHFVAALREGHGMPGPLLSPRRI